MVRLKCDECGKKIPLGLDFKCKCERVFCSKHRLAEDHNCTFDYVEFGKQLIESNNRPVIASKVNKLD